MRRANLNILLGDYNTYQKVNYIKYLLSGRRRSILKYKPMTISIVSTQRCTLSCNMCPTHSNIVPKDYEHRQNVAKDMSFELFGKTLGFFPEALTLHIIGAGEPMLNRDFFKMVDSAKNRFRMEVKSFTNGTTIGEKMGDILNSRLDSLTVSINGHNKEEFSRMTGMPESIFEKIYNDTKRLISEKNKRRSKLEVKLSFIVDKVNYRFLPEMIKLARELGADHTFLCNFLCCPYGELTPEKRAITKEDNEIIEFIKKFKNSLPLDIRKNLSFPAAIDTKSTLNNCNIHFEQVRIDGDGNVSSCSMMLLNMEETGKLETKDPWNSPFLVNMRKKFLEAQELEELCYFCPSNKGVEI